MGYKKTDAYIAKGSKSWKSSKDSLMTFGNKKMTIPLFNIPAVSTCSGSTEFCRKYCYAKSSEELFPSVKAKRARNLIASKASDFVSRVISELQGVKFIPYVRIHESGDFYSQEYLEKWYEICKAFPERKFLAFTKCFKLDFSKKPDNLNLYYSAWSDTNQETIPAGGNRAYTVITYKWFEKLGYEPLNTGTAVKCKGFCDDCLVCFEKKSDVYFPIHGRGTKV